MIGLVSDLMASNRRILADTQYHVRRMEYEMEDKMRKAEGRAEHPEDTGGH